MRIYDPKNEKVLHNILIMLTPSEVHELTGKLKNLSVKNDHAHIDDDQYKREITVGLVTPETIPYFSADVIRLLQEDE